MRAVDNLELERLRGREALDVLRLMCEYTKLDRDFVPVRAASTHRVHVSTAGTERELVVDGTRFFDTRARKGGGGAVALVMHPWRAPFKQAAKMLREAGA
jgi:hypothetical protein